MFEVIVQCVDFNSSKLNNWNNIIFQQKNNILLSTILHIIYTNSVIFNYIIVRYIMMYFFFKFRYNI